VHRLHLETLDHALALTPHFLEASPEYLDGGLACRIFGVQAPNFRTFSHEEL